MKPEREINLRAWNSIKDKKQKTLKQYGDNKHETKSTT